MGVVRNFIEILGIAKEDDLPEKSLGQLIKYNETENIFIPEDNSGIKDIYQIGINIDIKSKRTINTKDYSTVSIDGSKQLKIVCSREDNPDKMVILNLQLPYNTFIEVPKAIGDIENIHIYILDAYFDLLDKKRIYANFLYLVDVRYSMIGIEPINRKNSKVELLSFEEKRGEDVPQIALSYEEFSEFDEREEAFVRQSTECCNKISEDIDCLYL